jgi:hypothetical protein
MVLNEMEQLFSVAGIGFALKADQGIMLPDPSKDLRLFLSDGPVDYKLRVTLDAFPGILKRENLSFQTDHWLFYQFHDQIVAKIPPYGVKDSWIYIALYPQEHCGTIYIDRAFYSTQQHPLFTPVFEIIFATLLAKQGGFLAHASGVLFGQRTLLFSGRSGIGKTTTARLWETHASAVVLCDDRVAVRKIGGEFWAFGTPWHGNHQAVSPQGGRLDKIFFLKHALENRAERMLPVKSSALLYARSFPPLWDKSGLGTCVETSVNLALQVPCYELGFLPDDSAVKYVQGLE